MTHFPGATPRPTSCFPPALKSAIFALLLFFFTQPVFAKANAAPLPLIPAQTGADFVVDAVHPDIPWPRGLEDPAKRDRLVFWGSWMRHPVEGNVTLGPFKPPAHFSLLVSGMPFDHGNLLLLIRLPDHAVLVVTRETPGNQWKKIDIDLPPDWIGKNIQLQGVGYQHTPDSWLAFSEPFNLAPDGTAVPLWFDRTKPLRWTYWWKEYLLPIFVIFGLFSIIGMSGFVIVRSYLQTPAYITPIIVAAIVAFCGYVTFWGFFIRAPVGMGVAWGIFALASLHLIVRLIRQRWHILPSADWTECGWPVLILIIATLFYLALLNLPRVESTSMEVLASRRPATWTLPSDNVLQQDIAYFLYHGQDSRTVNTPLWQSSDRPPLECGVQLLAAPFLHGVFRFKWDVSAQLSGMVLQMIWVYAVWAVVRALGLSTRAAGQIVLCLIATPFLYINSIFIWSKLSAATFAIGAMLILCFRQQPLNRRDTILAGAMIALGMLAHSGTIFFLIPVILLWMVFRGNVGRPSWGTIVLLGGATICLFLPWTLYQKVYDPPGDHLLKLHLAGAMDDPVTPAFDNHRSTGQAIKEAYHSTPWATLWSNRVANFNSLIKGDWLSLWRPLSNDIARSREECFLYTFRSCGIYMLGVIALCAVPLIRGGQVVRPYLYLLSIICVSLVLWCLIMFGPDSTIVHQGAYANQLLLLVVLVCLLRYVHPVVLALLCIYNLVQFLWIYADCLPYPAVTDKVSVGLLSATIFAGCVIWVCGGKTDAMQTKNGNLLR